MKSVRVLITDSCNANCPFCINKNIRKDNGFMSLGLFKRICSYFANNNIQNIRIMGGEPTIHPHFCEMMQIAQSHFKRVTVFTNAINKNITQFLPREADGVNYNFSFSKSLTEEKLLPTLPGNRLLEILITRDTNPEIVEKEINRIVSLSSHEIIVSLTLDCTSNIFKDKEIIVPIFTKIQSFCDKHNINWRFDHSMPICFVYGTKLPIREKGSICEGNCAGLIDTAGNLRFCNQFNSDAYSILEDDEFVPMPLIENYLKLSHYKNQIKVLEKICAECPYFDKICNGGCFIANDSISREDIIQNTNLSLC